MPVTIFLALFLACNKTSAPVSSDSGGAGGDSGSGLPSPEDIVASAADGDTVHFQGTVHALTFDSTGEGSGEETEDVWNRLPGRWLLVWSAPPQGVEHDEIALEDVEKDSLIRKAWGLGIVVDPTEDIPRIGETVEVQGTFHDGSWNDHPVPIVDEATILSRSGTTLATEGQACSRDADCIDALVCDRLSQTCAPPTETGWGSLWRDVDGHCYTDEDCPLGQVCDTSYVVADTGSYTWRYDGSDKKGASLCVPDTPDDPQAVCGRIDHPDDLAGGRFTEGKEFCIQGTVAIEIQAEDGDTHVQIQVDEPLPYPRMDADIFLFGATTEIGPPFKNPKRPQGALADPAMGQEIIALGTYHWDSGHGWFEMHPLKQWWAVKPEAARAAP